MKPSAASGAWLVMRGAAGRAGLTVSRRTAACALKCIIRLLGNIYCTQPQIHSVCGGTECGGLRAACTYFSGRSNAEWADQVNADRLWLCWKVVLAISHAQVPCIAADGGLAKVEVKTLKNTHFELVQLLSPSTVPQIDYNEVRTSKG